jgi:hypothetical protein
MLYVNSDKANTGVTETNTFVNDETSPQATVSINKYMCVLYALCS